MTGQLMIALTTIASMLIKGTTTAPLKFISEHLDSNQQVSKEAVETVEQESKDTIKDIKGSLKEEFTYEALCQKVERSLGEESSCTGTFIKGERMYYCFKTLKRPHVQLLIREDGKLFDAYTYHAEGELQLI